MSTKIRIEEADNSCIDDLVSLLKDLFSIEEDFSFDQEKQERGLRKIIKSTSAHLFAALSGERVVGMCSLQVLISTAEGGNVGVVEDMVIAEEFRKSGIGEKLLLEIEKKAVELGLTRLQLLADRNNTPALKFYKKTGWVETGLICLRKK